MDGRSLEIVGSGASEAEEEVANERPAHRTPVPSGREKHRHDHGHQRGRPEDGPQHRAEIDLRRGPVVHREPDRERRERVTHDEAFASRVVESEWRIEGDRVVIR